MRISEMRVCDSAKLAPPVCFVESMMPQHDTEHKVKKTFTYVSEKEGEDFTLDANLESAIDDLEDIQKLLKEFRSVGTKKARREIRGLLKDLFYSVKAEIFDAEEQMFEATELQMLPTARCGTPVRLFGRMSWKGVPTRLCTGSLLAKLLTIRLLPSKPLIRNSADQGYRKFSQRSGELATSCAHAAIIPRSHCISGLL